MLSITLLFSFVSYKLCGAKDQNTKNSIEDAIGIASIEAKKLGYDVENMEVTAAEYDNPQNPYLDSDNEYCSERKEKLKGKQYWAVYYSGKGLNSLGGDICVFVDKQSGKVITDYRGK
jgi:hypothetical protein